MHNLCNSIYQLRKFVPFPSSSEGAIRYISSFVKIRGQSPRYFLGVVQVSWSSNKVIPIVVRKIRVNITQSFLIHKVSTYQPVLVALDIP